MGKLFEQFATNRKHEAEGIWIETSPAEPSTGAHAGTPATRFRVARRNRMNKRYRAALDREIKPYQIQVKAENLDPEIDQKISLKVFCETILLDWEGVTHGDVHGGEDETPCKYTVENGILLMERLPDLYDTLSENAGKASNFRDAQREEATKN